MKEDIQKLHEKVEFLEVKAIEIGNSELNPDSNNKEFERMRIDTARGKAIAYGYVKSMINDILKKNKMMIKQIIKKRNTIDSYITERENAIISAIVICTFYAGFVLFIAFVIFQILKVMPN